MSVSDYVCMGKRSTPKGVAPVKVDPDLAKKFPHQIVEVQITYANGCKVVARTIVHERSQEMVERGFCATFETQSFSDDGTPTGTTFESKEDMLNYLNGALPD